MQIDHLAIVVTDLERSKLFYQKIFKAKLTQEAELKGEWFSQLVAQKNAQGRYASLALPTGDLTLELLEFAQPATQAQDRSINLAGFRHLAWSVKSAKAIYEYLQNLKIPTLSPPVDNQMGKLMFYFRGPDGEIWEVAEYQAKGKKVAPAKSKIIEEAIIYADGACRGNPGQASFGVVIYDQSKQKLAELSEAIGVATNNQAEWRGLIAGVKKALELGVKRLAIFLDSDLVVRQARGEYKVKNPELQKLYLEFWQLRNQLTSIQIKHVPREQNRLADKLANLALDKEI
jgi:ribonuclease HI